MNRAILAFCLVFVALTSCSATLKVRCTAPVYDNDGPCAAPTLLPRSGPITLHFSWSGRSTGEDSVLTTSGALVTFQRQVPAGTYTVTAWATDMGGMGCDTSITVIVKAPPNKPALAP